tara:strand:+ start:777 stop:1298 length:522 start_codon:yes stop_codon:yes gene_type:complete
LLANLSFQRAGTGQLIVGIAPQSHVSFGKHVFSGPVPSAGLGFKRFSRLLNPAIAVDDNGGFLELSLERSAEDRGAVELRFEWLLSAHDLCSEIPGGVLGSENAVLSWHAHDDRSHHHQITDTCVALETVALKLLKHGPLLVASLRQNRTLGIQHSGIQIPAGHPAPERRVWP